MSPEKPETADVYIELLVRILRDTAAKLNIRSQSVERDVKSVRRRYRGEGLAFLTKTLPKLGKAFDKALATDTILVVPPEFQAVDYGSIKIPKFLGLLWKLVFCPDGTVKLHDQDQSDMRIYRSLGFGETWTLDDDANLRFTEGRESRLIPMFSQVQVTAVRAIRQVCYLAYKLELPYEEDVDQAKYDQFVELDASLYKEGDCVPLSSEATNALENASLLLSFLFRDFEPRDIVPKHGPGSVATGEKPHQKFSFRRIYGMLEEVYGVADYFFFNFSHLCDQLSCLEGMEEIPESTTKVVLVPKDSRGPRMIAMEPLEVQWIQQGLARKIVDVVEDPNSITSGFVNFTDQKVNRDLALGNSLDGDFVTLDLSDASDRVSVWLVRRLFPKHVASALMSCRSGWTELPDGRRIELNKFASMGSACCFPVEALVFWALAVGSLTRLTCRRDLDDLPEVYVYGDDIVTRKCDYEKVGTVFEELQLVLSEDKCCTGRFFRESCGCDAFKGVDVTPVRLHTLWPTFNSRHGLLSYVAYANALFAEPRNFGLAATFLQDTMERQFGSIPRAQAGSRFAFAFAFPKMDERRIARWNRERFKTRFVGKLERFEFRVPTFRSSTIECATELDWANIWTVNHLGSDPFGFNVHLKAGEFTIPRIVKPGWTWVSLEDLLA